MVASITLQAEKPTKTTLCIFKHDYQIGSVIPTSFLADHLSTFCDGLELTVESHNFVALLGEVSGC